MIDLHRILKEIVHECKNGCTDAATTWKHFERINTPLTPAEWAFVHTLNFSAIREKAADLARYLEDAPNTPVSSKPLSTVFYVVEMIETERGWGQRPDGFLVFHNEESAKKYVQQETADRTGPAPDEYTIYNELGYRECTEKIARAMQTVDATLRLYSDSSPVTRK